jgi:PilZ domain
MRQEWVGKRQAVRTNVHLRAQMRFGAGRPAAECIVTDISPTGARVVVPEEGDYPNEFDIYIPARSETKWARIRWREKLQFGVEFLKVRQDDPDGVQASMLDRVARLETRLAGDAAGSGQQQAEIAEAPAALDFETRLTAVEARLEHLTSSTAVDAGRPALEADLDRAEPDAERTASSAPTSPSDLSELEALVARLARSDGRFDQLDAELDRRAVESTDAASRIGALVKRVQALETASELATAGGSASVAATSLDPAVEARLGALEASFAELRAGVRTLVLLTASQIKRSGA